MEDEVVPGCLGIVRHHLALASECWVFAEIVGGVPALAYAFVRHIVEGTFMAFSERLHCAVRDTNPPATTAVLRVGATHVTAAAALGVAWLHFAQDRATVAVDRWHPGDLTSTYLLTAAAICGTGTPLRPIRDLAVRGITPLLVAVPLVEQERAAIGAAAERLGYDDSGGVLFAATASGRARAVRPPIGHNTINRAHVQILIVRARLGVGFGRAGLSTALRLLECGPFAELFAGTTGFGAG